VSPNLALFDEFRAVREGDGERNLHAAALHRNREFELADADVALLQSSGSGSGRRDIRKHVLIFPGRGEDKGTRFGNVTQRDIELARQLEIARRACCTFWLCGESREGRVCRETDLAGTKS